MPVKIPPSLSGDLGQSVIQRYSHPAFLFYGTVEIEKIFAEFFKNHFTNFYAEGEVVDPPAIMSAYVVQDQKFHAVVIEANLTTMQSQGLDYNRQEVYYYPDPEDITVADIYEMTSADANYSVDIFIRSQRRSAVILMADWVLAGLLGPQRDQLDRSGIMIAPNGIRTSGKPQAQQGSGDPKNLIWNITINLTNIIIPWARAYKRELPALQTIALDISAGD